MQQCQSLLTRIYHELNTSYTNCSKSCFYSDVNIVHHCKREMVPLSVWSTTICSSSCGCLCIHKLSPGGMSTVCGQAVCCITGTPNRSVLSSQPLIFNKHISSLQSYSCVCSLAQLPWLEQVLLTQWKAEEKLLVLTGRICCMFIHSRNRHFCAKLAVFIRTPQEARDRVRLQHNSFQSEPPLLILYMNGPGACQWVEV